MTLYELSKPPTASGVSMSNLPPSNSAQAARNERMKMEVRCQREPGKDGVEIAVFEKHPTGRVMYAERLTMRELPSGEYIGEPTMRLKNNEAQMLMDELWRCGLRPNEGSGSEGSGSAGSLAATERHLKDMRAIALGLLSKDGVQAVGVERAHGIGG